MLAHHKIFLKYTIPTVMGMVVTTLYTFVDGIFIGQYVGANALASINLIWPFLSLVIAISAMIATGGGALVSINFGRKNHQRAQNLFAQSIGFSFTILLLFSGICLLFPTAISRMLGASDILLEGCVTYIRYFMGFGIFFGMAIVLNTFVNNDRNPLLAFMGMVSGCVTNIFLDWLFVGVYGWGLQGAAVASGIGQVVAVFTLLIHFIGKKGDLRLKLARLVGTDILKILKTGLPILISELSIPLSAVAYNYVIIHRMGELGIAAFGVINYIITVFLCIFSGVAQGIQPPISRYYGAKDDQMVKKIFTMGWMCNLTLGTGIYVLLFIFSRQAVMIFTHDEAVIPIAINAMRIYTLYALFAGLNIVMMSLFQATRFTKVAGTISFFRTFCFNLLFILILPPLFGETGIWLAMTFAEGTAFIIAYLLYQKNKSRLITSDNAA